MPEAHNQVNEYIVLDANIWQKHLLLRDPAGAALLFLVQQGNRCIAIPEVIEMELVHHAVLAGRDAKKKIIEAFDTIARLIGARPVYEPPEESRIREAISQRLGELEQLTTRIGFTLEHAKNSLRRVDSKEPPNAKSQEFKDSAIWESILELSREKPIHFVTEDKAFYEQRTYEKGIANNLKVETANASNPVTIHRCMKALLETLRTSTPDLDLRFVADSVDSIIREKVQKDAAFMKLVILSRIDFNGAAFVTERIGQLALSFTVTYSLEDAAQDADALRAHATAKVSGSCGYRVQDGHADDAHFDRIEYAWVDGGGTTVRQSSVFIWGAASAFIGATERPHNFRERLMPGQFE
ncbi:MAG: hypothetical protein C0504_18920 [Candidatus Solibacter sp.]|nr:hypothetical protein [Candidatus Solibacter sp.]